MAEDHVVELQPRFGTVRCKARVLHKDQAAFWRFRDDLAERAKVENWEEKYDRPAFRARFQKELAAHETTVTEDSRIYARGEHLLALRAH